MKSLLNNRFTSIKRGVLRPTKQMLMTACIAISFACWSQTVIINEIHYDPDVKTDPVEFIELYNASASTADLSGWRLDNGVEYTFPGGTLLAEGGYLVIAQNPAALQSKFGATALGPWVGKLDNQGETISLKNAVGDTEDKVDYQLGFPWPTVGDAPGYSIELINPALDNHLGGNWRVSIKQASSGSGSQELIPIQANWKYRKGSSEASSPTGLWRNLGWNDDSWLPGQAPVGYGQSGHVLTDLGDMNGSYSSVFFRKTFVVDNPAEVTSLLLEASYDDGFKAWINGTNVVNVNISTAELAYNGTADGALENLAYNPFVLNNPGSYLVAGTNMIAVQAHNASLGGSSDFWFDARLAEQTGPANYGPTPGQKNAAYASSAPPAIRQVDHDPKQPLGGQSVTVTAKVTDPDTVGGVSLLYQIVAPGSYIKLTDPAYESSWTTLAMNDDGTHGDAMAGDSIYTAVIPPSVQQHRRLVRYRISATDGASHSVTAPYADDPQPNFAYFCYDGIPAWQGANQPGTSPVETFSSQMLESIPVYHLIANGTDVYNCQYNGSYRNTRFPGAMVYDGEVYDHIEFNIRGEYSTYVTGKNKWRYRFNRGHYFQARDNVGKKYGTRWKDMKVNGGAAPWTPPNRGMGGVDECLSFRLFELAGIPSSRTSYFHFRVIDNATEASPSTQYEGDLWGLYYSVEVPDGRFLDDRNLPDGNLYKLETPVVQDNQGTDEPLGPADYDAVRSVLNTGSTEQWWRDHVDHVAYGRYKGVAEGVAHYDQRDGSQGYYFHNPEIDKWVMLPWDLDTMFQLTSKYYTWDRIRLCLNAGYPNLLREGINEQREILDLLFNAKAVDTAIGEFADIIDPPGQALTWADADQFMWNHHPRMTEKGSFNLLTASGNPAGHWYTRTLVSADHEGQMDYLRRFMQPGFSDSATPGVLGGYDKLVNAVADSAIPNTPTLTFTGDMNYPLNGLSFQSSSFSGSGVFAAMEWRSGEVLDISAPAYDPTQSPPYEVTTKWESGELSTFNADHTIPIDALKVGHTYRVRVRTKDTTGRWSHWSAPVEFTTTEASTAGAMISHLRISEVMYDSPEGSDVEFVELHNTSTNLTLDLGGAAFTEGIDYNFPGGTTIAPGGYLLVVGNADPAAFRAHYGLDAGVAVAGPYFGKLSNNGEELRLKTAPGGSEIAEFTYGNGRTWPLAAAGAGHALVPVDPAASGQATGALDYPGNWRASAYRGGSPGAADPVPPASVVLNEITAHTDYSNPSKPEYDSNDWIELHNPSGSSISLDGWYLSDDLSNPKKWAIPAVSIPAGGHLVFNEVDDFHSPIASGFGLDKAGEQVLLSYLPGTAADRVVDFIGFKGQENGPSLSRYPDGTGRWHSTDPSSAVANTAPLSGLRLTEVMYQPPLLAGLDNVRDEYVEIFNPTASDVTMQNVAEAWRLNGGIEYTFPDNTVLPAGERLLVVSFDPADTLTSNAFVAAYSITANVRIFGPYSGKLGNRSDRATLEKPQLPDAVGEAYSWVIEDEMIYCNQNPWPTSAAGTGSSLERISMNQHGLDPDNWNAAAPSPGAESSDRDGDGMPSDWENTYSLDPGDPADANVDSDGDGLTNLEEYWSGTDPHDPGSVLKFDWVGPSNAVVNLRFTAMSGKSYTIEYRLVLDAGTWQVLTNFGAAASTETVIFSDPASSTNNASFYRIVTP